MSSPPPGRKCLEGSTTVSDSDSEDEPKLPLNQFYPYIRCALCCGFLIDATTITECLHTFCKSCILKHFFYSNRCPTCSVVVHQTQPLYNIRPDRQLQDIVYKMVPFLEEYEREQMSNFYEERGLEVPKPVVVSPAGPVLRRQKKDNVPQSAFTIPPELDLSLLLEFVGSTSESDSEWEPARTQSGVDESSSSSSDEEDPPSFRGRARARERARARRRSRRSSSRGETSTPGVERWCGVDEPDITPPQPTFRPSRTPGSQLIMTATYSAFELFQLFFTNTILQRILYNTNQHGRAHYSSPSKPWKDINLQDMYSFLSIVLYMGFVKCTALTDYWRGGNLYNLPFPQKVISRSKWLRILQALHLSSAEDDAANEEKRGTPAFDRLGKIKPLYEEIKEACRRNYHPGQEISIDERMVASKACVLFKQYMKGKPVRWGFKLFVLADSSNGYTWDFFVYEGKIDGASGKGLSYDVVMRLMDTSFLGTGYKLFVDNFYTSPTLFRDLLQQKIWACGTIRTNRVGYPKTKLNALDPTSPRGSIRWLRTSSLLFVQWRDTRDVFLCSTIHTAHGNETVSRRVKDNSGRWTVKNVPLPPAVKDYNRCMGGVDVSDALIGYYQVLHKTHKWYKTFFYHFLDIAVVNAFLLYKDLCKAKGEAPMPQKAFREILAQQLWQVGSQRSTPGPSLQPSGPSRTHHRLVYISGDRTGGRLKCRKCHAKTAVKCSTCDKPLCFVPERDCYNQWHIENNM